MPSWIAAALVFVSGFCALVYQVVWTRELRLVFGASTAASSAVIAIFIAGLGWGGLWFGRRVERSAQPLAFYAGLELGIAVLSAVTPWLLDLVRTIYLWSGGSLTLGPAGSSALRVALSALVLGPATWLMGGTLPAIARAVETERDVGRSGVAWMYGLNTLGAVVGCSATTFVMLEHLGSRTSLYVACALNVLVAAAARVTARYLAFEKATRGRTSPAPSAPSAIAETEDAPAAPPWLVLASAAVVGFAFFLMELVWYRMLGPLLGGTIFTFGLILAIALAGIGLGSTLYALAWSTRRPRPIGFAITCVLEAACIAAPYALGDRVALWAVYLRAFDGLGWGGLVGGWALLVLAVVFPAALIAGVQFPMLIALLGTGRRHVGRHVGTAYAANTLGAVVGALAGGFGLMPAIGALGSWKLVVYLLAAWGLGVAIFSLLRGTARAGAAVVVALSVATVLMLQALGPTAAWRHSPIGAGRVPFASLDSPNTVMAYLTQQRRSIDWQTDGIESAIGIGIRDAVGFIVNGKSDGNARTDAPTQVMGALVGAALLPKVDRAMVIGLGTGSTAGWLGKVPEIQRVDVAEIEPAIRVVAERCALVNERVLENPKVKIHRGDARELLSVSRDRYDLVFSEPSNPYRAGVASLYTRDFYRRIEERLTPGGLFVQWLQSYDVDAVTLQTVFATLQQVFPHVEAWSGLRHDLLLVASREPLVHDLERLRSRVESEPFRRAMRVAWHTEGVEGFLSHYVASPGFIRAVVRKAGAINTDDRSPVEFAFARSLRGSAQLAAESLYEAIRSRKASRPNLRGEVVAVDWERVDFEREAFAQLTGGVEGSLEHLTPVYRVRLDMITRWMRSDFQGAIAQWATALAQGAQQPTMIERLALAELYAYGDDAPTFQQLAAALEREHPTEAAAVRAMWHFNHGRRAEGTDHLVRALEAYRTDPWPVHGQFSRVFHLMQPAGPDERALALRWLAALSEPFAVYVNETARERARVNIASELGASHRACLDIFTELEPYVPWAESMLEFRLKCYEAHRHPLADRAAADLVQYRKVDPPAYVERR